MTQEEIKKWIKHAYEQGYPVRVNVKTELLAVGGIKTGMVESIAGGRFTISSSGWWHSYEAVISVEPLEPVVEEADGDLSDWAVLARIARARRIRICVTTAKGAWIGYFVQAGCHDGDGYSILRLYHGGSERVYYRDVTELKFLPPEPRESGILGEFWHIEDGLQQAVCDTQGELVDQSDWLDEFSALPDMARVLRMVKQTVGDIEAALKKAGIE